MKKVLFLIPSLAHGGAEKVLVNLVNHLDKSKFDITVQTLFDGGVNKQYLKPHIKTNSVFKRVFPGNSKIFTLFSPRFLYKNMIREHFDIVVSYLEGPTARIVSGCSEEITKLVCWIHVQQDTLAIACSSFRNYQEAKKCYDRFDEIICVSEYVKSNFINNFGGQKNINVLYNTNNTKYIIEQSKAAVDDYDFDDSIPTLVGIGTLKKSKGFDKIIRIHNRLLKNGIKQRLIILGVGEEEENLKNLISRLGVSETVSLLGYKTNPYKYINKCNMFICASIAEGFSTAATEALVLGVPVVTVDVSGMKEMLGENNEYGIITENNEQALYEGVKGILTTPGKLDHYAEKASERGRYFSTEKTVRAVEEMLLNL